MSLWKPIVCLFLTLLAADLSAQQKYWVNTADTSRLSTILPAPEVCSDWLKACSYQLSPADFKVCLSVADIQKVRAYELQNARETKPTLGFAMEQIKAEAFIKEGLTGKGIKIAIIDGGFLKANESPSLKHFFEQNQVNYYKDYVTPEMEPYSGSSSLDDNHGTEVWQLIGGFHAKKNIQYGLATKANYYLARTDHGAYEKRIEEDHLIKAIEDMEEMGVRLVNISLGYSEGFNQPEENYTPDQMDGQTSVLAKAVEVAVLEKGMLIVVSAGNEAKDDWKTLSTPADAQHALTVGASKFKVWDKMDYSSIGPDYTDFVKPDVSVYATMGTSYAAPVITGMAACMWERDSTLTNLQIMDILKKSGHFYPYPNNYLGYGVPTCPKVLQIMDGKKPEKVKVRKTSKNRLKLKNDFEVKYLVAFHKKNATHVLARVVYRPMGKKVKIKRYGEAHQTSLLIGQEVIEIFWKD